MGLLDNVERGIEKVVRGAFSRSSNSQVQPVEIANALRRELDNKSMTLAAGRTLAPNIFDARLSDPDFARAQQWGQVLAEELCDVVIAHVKSQGYTLQGPVRVSFTRDSSLKGGQFTVLSAAEKSAGSPGPLPDRPDTPRRQPARGSGQPTSQPAGQRHPVLDVNGQRYSLNAPSIVLGRSSEADILIDDTGVSRRHLEIRTENGASHAVDLGSTNGSYVNGQRLKGSAELADGSVILMGRTKITFRLMSLKAGGR